MSATLLWIMCAVIVVSLATWLVLVGMADRTPYFRRPHIERRRGRVRGGTHVGGGRSVGPRRDWPISPDEDPEDATVPGPGRSGVHRPGTSPLDL